MDPHTHLLCTVMRELWAPARWSRKLGDRLKTCQGSVSGPWLAFAKRQLKLEVKLEVKML